ncbi:MAG TPA: translocation/assembly module TamB domain-containing protein [Chitinophagales bacterium]|nr:translocation/assembly module TamB domain-containing protein [Chitinophagales bacterium]
MSARWIIGNSFFILLGIILIAAGWFMYKIHDPEFQTRLTQKVTRYLSKKVNSEISIGHVEVQFFHSLVLSNVLVKDQNHDTLLAAKKLEAQFSIISLLHSKYAIDHITLSDGDVYLHRPKNDSNWNFQFILDALKSKNKTSNPSKLELALAKVRLNQVHFVLLDEPNIIRLNFFLPLTSIDVRKMDLDQPKFDLKNILIDHADLQITKLLRTEIDTSTFPQPDTAVVHINTRPIQLVVDDLRFVDSRFSFDDMNEAPATTRFDLVHQSYSHLDLHFTNGSLLNDTIKAHISNISAREKSGFVLNHLEADAKVTTSEAVADHLKITTPNSTTGDFFSFSYTNFHDFLNFNEEVNLNADFDQSTISMKDIGYFIPGAKGNSEKLIADGDVKGTIENLKSKNLKLQTGSNTHFSGNIELKGLPEINETYIDLKVNDLVTDVNDIHRWIPGTQLPPAVMRLGSTHFNGSFSGFINDFVAYGVFNTQLGQVTSDLNMKFKNGVKSAQYSGNLATNDFNLGRMIAEDSVVGKISFALNVNGSGLDVSTMNAKMSGTIQQFDFRKYNYQNAAINGTFDSKVFSGQVILHDPNAHLIFNGLVDFNKELPVYDFKAKLDSANLLALKFSDDPYILSVKMDMNMRGKNIDDFLGYAKATDIVFSDDKARFRLDSLVMDIDQKENGNGRKLILTTSIAAARFDGKFALTKLPAAFLSVIDHYFPSLPGDYSQLDTLEDFDFRIALNKVSGAEHFFLPELRGMDSTNIRGHFNSRQHSISFTGKVPALGYKSFDFGDVYVGAETKNDSFRVTAGSHDIQIGDSLVINNPVFITVLHQDSATVFLRGSSPDRRNYMNLLCKITGDSTELQLHVLPSDLVMNGRAWQISRDNLITYDDDRLIFHNFSFSNESRLLTVKNVNLRVHATNLEFDFADIPLADTHELIKWNHVAIEGNLNGSMQVLNVFNAPRIDAATTISDFSANGKKVGLVTANISYVPEDDRMTMEMLLNDAQYDVKASGTYYPRRVTDQLNLDVDVKKANLEMLEGVLFDGIISNTQGSASGKLSVMGSAAKPVLTGQVNIASLSTKINYLQTTYHCSNEDVIFKDGIIDLGKLVLFDEYNNTADAKGEIFHDHLSHWSMNVAITTNKFLAMKTTEKDDSVYYGTAVASGIIQFDGPIDEMVIRASVTSMKGTTINIPISNSTSAGQRSFIQYINKKQDTVATVYAGYERMAGVTLNFNMDITPEAVIQIIFDQQTGDIIKGSGSGNISMEINTKGEFSMYGTFTIDHGNYLFTQFNFFNKYFSIEKGGTISWNGDPYEAQIDLSALYTTKASLIDLLPTASIGSISTQDRSELQRRYITNLYLKLTGSLFSPDISFDIKLPEVSSVSSTANIELLRLKQDENEMNKQAFAILVFGHFIPTDNSGLGGQSIGTEGINSLSDFISGQINTLASSLRSDIDFSLNYQSYEANLGSGLNASDPNNLVKRNELQVALTKRFFNDRLSIDVGGNFDFGGTATSATTNQTTTGVAGDFAVEYKITPDGRVTGKVFSTSDYSVVDERNKTKNGVAISYTRDFDNLKELFKNPDKKKKKRLKHNPQELPPDAPMNTQPPGTSAK